jgi:hypothetical protein
MVRSEKPKRSTTAPASAARRAQVADRDTKFIEYLKREDIQEKMNALKPSKRMGFLIKSFKEETDITVPTTMAYRAWHKAFGSIKTNKNGAVKFPSDSSEGEPINVPVTVPQWEEDEPSKPVPEENRIKEETEDII